MELGKSDRGSRRKEDLGDVTKWGLGDLAQFGQVMKQYEGDIVQLKGGTSSQQQSLRELQSNMLKGMPCSGPYKGLFDRNLLFSRHTEGRNRAV